MRSPLLPFPSANICTVTRAACRRKLLAADRGQCDSGARQDLRRLCEQRTGQRRRTAGGFDEAIFLNENGHVAEGATCNIFMVRNGKLITPLGHRERARRHHARLHHGTGICAKWGCASIERPIDRSELYICDELFFTGTAVGVAPIVRVDHRPVKDGTIGAVTQGLQQLYFDATRGHLRLTGTG